MNRTPSAGKKRRSRIVPILRKEIAQVLRDKRTLTLIFIQPMIMLILFAYALESKTEHLSTAYLNQDGGTQSRTLLDGLINSQYFNLNHPVSNMDEVKQLMDSGDINAAVVIPPDFSKNIRAGKQTYVQLFTDGTVSAVAETVLNSANFVVQQQSMAAGAGMAEPATLIELRPQVWYNPSLRGITFVVPGVMAFILQQLILILTSQTIVQERETGSMEQLIVSPIQPYELMLGKLLPQALFAFLEVIIILIVGTLWFKLTVQGSVFLLIALSLPFIFCSLGLGLFISTVSKNQRQAIQATMLIVIPSVVLSGVFFPRETMPSWIHALGYAVPLTYYVQILRGIVVKGVGFQYLMDETLALILLATVIMILSTARFKKKLE